MWGASISTRMTITSVSSTHPLSFSSTPFSISFLNWERSMRSSHRLIVGGLRGYQARIWLSSDHRSSSHRDSSFCAKTKSKCGNCTTRKNLLWSKSPAEVVGLGVNCCWIRIDLLNPYQIHWSHLAALKTTQNTTSRFGNSDNVITRNKSRISTDQFKKNRFHNKAVPLPLRKLMLPNIRT